MKKNLAIVRTLTEQEMDIIEEALEYWLDDNSDDEDAAIVARARELYDELTEEDV